MNVVVYTKSGCPACLQAKMLLNSKGIGYSEWNIEEIPLALDIILEKYPEARQMPQIWIEGQRVGGLAGLQAALKELAHAKGVPSMVTSAMLALQDKLSYALDQLAVLEPLAKRMALDLECLTLDPTSARWHDTAVESLQAYRDLMDAWYPQDHVSPLGKD